MKSPIGRIPEKEWRDMEVMLPIVKAGENSIHVDGDQNVVHTA